MSLKIETVSADPISPKRYLLSYAGTAIGIVGFKRENLLLNLVYVTYQPINEPSIAALRALKREFDQLPPAYFFCQVAQERPEALRFAEFFGFKFTGAVEYRYQLEKEPV